MCGERDESWGKNEEDEYILLSKYITYNRVDIFQKSQNDFIWLDLLFFFTISHLKVWFLFITHILETHQSVPTLAPAQSL